MILREIESQFIWQGYRTGRPVAPSHFRALHKKTLEEMGMRYLPSHSCRHIYISQMQALGVRIETIQSFVGHADTDMTVHYLHMQDAIRLDAISRFDRAFGGKIPLHDNTSIV
ncbi:MAG: tyrosine-type recombinase/integrase [Clostridiales bacterium]|nr:tyrosine-type recombinase/integrase [Candidatus Cacconaster stercorequi]